MNEKCSKCGEYLNGYSGRGNICQSCNNAYMREYRKRNPPDKAKERRRVRKYLYAKYGISEQEYNDRLKKQNGNCALCHKPAGERRLEVDHNHTTGNVRELLHPRCNKLLGFCNDNILLLENAIAYLSLHNVPEPTTPA